MNNDEVLKDLNYVKQVLQEFNAKHGNDIADFVVRENLSDEENLIANTLLSVILKSNEISSSIENLQKPIKYVGTLSKNAEKKICFNGSPLPHFTELEVLIHDEVNHGWTTTMIGIGRDGYYLVGLPKDTDINGIPARIR